MHPIRFRTVMFPQACFLLVSFHNLHILTCLNLSLYLSHWDQFLYYLLFIYSHRLISYSNYWTRKQLWILLVMKLVLWKLIIDLCTSERAAKSSRRKRWELSAPRPLDRDGSWATEALGSHLDVFYTYVCIKVNGLARIVTETQLII